MRSNALLFVFGLFTFLIVSCGGLSPRVRAEEGVLDLSQWDFDKNPMVKIDGQWLLFPNTFLDPQINSDTSEAAIYEGGDSWSSLINGGFPTQMSATLKLKILLPENFDENYAIFVPAIWTSNSLFVNGAYSGSSGDPNVDPSQTKEALKIRISYIENSTTLELLFWISNKSFGISGIDYLPVFGVEKSVNRFFYSYLSLYFTIWGILFFVSVYLLIFFLNNRKEPKYLFLSLFSFACMLYLISYDSYVISFFYDYISAQLMMRIGAVAYPIAVVFLSLFILFHVKTHIETGFILIIFSLFAFFVAGIIIFASWSVVYLLLGILNIFVGLGSLYVVYLYIKMVKKVGKGELFHLISWLFLSASVVLEMIFGFYAGLLDYLSFFSLGIFIFILSHSQLLVENFGKLNKELDESLLRHETDLRVRTGWLREMNAKLENQIFTDTLTGLFNRAKLADPSLVSELYREPVLGILYIDLDNFKLVNDIISHNAGDIVLKKFAAILKELVRKNDIPVRIGGDEFVIFVTSSAGVGAEALAKRLLETISRKELFIEALEQDLGHSFEKAVFEKFSCSVGIYLLNYEGQDINTLISLADSALAEAKKRGKDTYSIKSDLS
ncbi:MAG: diguanylate cyclase [Spirochaetales bacterium]|nr:diguanylate cyclase [Spirochaetales bacterium]